MPQATSRPVRTASGAPPAVALTSPTPESSPVLSSVATESSADSWPTCRTAPHCLERWTHSAWVTAPRVPSASKASCRTARLALTARLWALLLQSSARPASFRMRTPPLTATPVLLGASACRTAKCSPTSAGPGIHASLKAARTQRSSVLPGPTV